MTTSKYLLALALVIPVASASAGALDEQRWKDDQNAALRDAFNFVNSQCGTAIAATFDWSSIKYDAWQKDMHTVYFQSVADALVSICHTSDGKTSVQKSIKTVVIKSDPSTAKIDLKNGELDWYLTRGSKTKNSVDSGDAVVWLNHHL